jgi:hypothetical protein
MFGRYVRLAQWLYGDQQVSYEVLPPSMRKQLIEETFAFFESEFRDYTNESLWQHLRGADVEQSDADWRTAHRKHSWLVRTAFDAVKTIRATRGGKRTTAIA